jgi:hypothetical protein
LTAIPSNDKYGTRNKKLYGKEVSAKDIVFKKAVPVPPSAKTLLATLQKASPKNKSNK